MTEYQINLASVRSFADFAAAFNTGVIHSAGGHWNSHLDTFNDYLSRPQDAPYRLVLLDRDRYADLLEQTPEPGGGSMLNVLREIFATTRT